MIFSHLHCIALLRTPCRLAGWSARRLADSASTGSHVQGPRNFQKFLLSTLPRSTGSRLLYVRTTALPMRVAESQWKRLPPCTVQGRRHFHKLMLPRALARTSVASIAAALNILAAVHLLNPWPPCTVRTYVPVWCPSIRRTRRNVDGIGDGLIWLRGR